MKIRAINQGLFRPISEPLSKLSYFYGKFLNQRLNVGSLTSWTFFWWSLYLNGFTHYSIEQLLYCDGWVKSRGLWKMAKTAKQPRKIVMLSRMILSVWLISAIQRPSYRLSCVLLLIIKDLCRFDLFLTNSFIFESIARHFILIFWFVLPL